MISALTTALSGLQASATRLQAGASNVANARSTGPLPPAEPAVAPADTRRTYIPVDAVQSSLPGGGVAASLAPRSPAYVPEYAPDSPDADARGFIAAPRVDLAQEAVGVIEASLAFRANLAVARAADRMLDGVLDLKA
jgi:flagellar basal-body rod protein FlgC